MAYGSGRRRADRIMAKLGRLCGVDPQEDDDAYLNRQRLILAEEEDVPLDDPVPQRAPYISPALVAVSVPDPLSSLDNKHPLAGSGMDGAQISDASNSKNKTSHGANAQPAALSTTMEEPVVDIDTDPVTSLEQVMTRVAQLEEQGRLVEASALMAEALTGSRAREDGVTS
eukprot:CAMPEP_0119320808 /NCGR_PEP_ID=MMETSP1333-20130426/53517_1 /TAXON_ID=418940 /ORGANISM="Scyphosphaera apsteinii, Strain RCC1455" /LENGTH=170 /DNA_ID=CAMNT_0007327609 /DNA_START=76 /DNA_END=588 /DNA_ORIENTATION=+